MPTVHVTPGSDLLLQEIANSLHKAKKVVVVTGAGISTNSGIPDFRSENGLYSLIQAQFDAASRELEKRAGERDAPSSPPLVEAIQERPSKRRKLSVQDEIAVQVESETPDESSRTGDAVSDVADQQSPQRAHPDARGEDDQPMTVDEGPSIIVAGDEGTSIRVASQDVSSVEESIVVLGDGAVAATPGGTSCESPGGSFAGAQASQSMVVKEEETGVAAVTGAELQTPNRRSPGLPPRQPKDEQSSASQPTFGPSESAPLTNLSSSPRASTPRISHLSSEIGHPTSYPFSSSPLSSPPPILSDPYEGSSLEPAYSQSESISAASVSSSTDSEETDQTEEDSGSSTPYLTSQSSCNSSQSKTTLPNLKGRDLFDASIWADPIKTSVFYTFATTLRQKARDVAPTTSHQFLGVLRDRRKLVRCYTQNIDRLEDRIGLSTSLELGAGSRARFSAKAWRNSGASGHHSQRPGAEDEGRVSAGEEAQAGVADQTPLNRPGHRDPGADRQAAQGQIHDGLGLLSGRSEGAGPGAGRTAGQSAVADPIEQSSLRLGSTTPTPSTAPFGPSQSSQEADEPDSGGAGGRGEDLVRQRGGGGEQQLPLPNPEPDAAAPPPPAPPAPTLSAPNRGVECVFLHGSLESLRCFLCGLTSSWDDSERELETLAGRQPTCPHCAGATAAREERGKRALGVGKLRPDIVLYGEEHPRSDLIGTIVQHDLSLGPDMLLILGTSLRVHGLKTVVREFAKAVHSKGGKVVFVNFTKPPDSVWSDVIDFWVQSDCDAWVLDIKTRKPALWLPPGTELEDEETKPSRSKRTSTSGSTSLRRESSGLSLNSDKTSKGTKRKSNGASTKLKRKDSGLSTVQESIDASKSSTSNNTSIDSSPILYIISDEPSAEQSIAVERPAKSRGRRPPHSLHVRQAFESMDASDQADGRSRLGTGKVEEGDEDTKVPKKLPAKRARKSLPTGSGLRPPPNREFKLNPNAKRPQAVRDEVQNGAYLSWKILEDLKRLTGQPKPSFIYANPPPPVPKAPRSKKPRKSAPAALCSEPKPPSSPLPSEMAGPLPLEEVPPFSSTQHFAASSPYDTVSRPLPAMSVPQDTELVTQLSAAMSLPLVESHIPHHPSTMPSSFNATSEEQEVNAESIEAPPQPPVEQPKVKRGRTTKPKPKRATVSLPAEVKTELPEETLPPTSTSTIPVVSPGSIGAAIKRNPRKRKRKTIDGVEVMLPTVNTRVPRPSLGQPKTPPTQTRDTAMDGYPPLTPHIMLPPPQPSITPVTARFAVVMELQHVQQGLEDGTMELPRVQDNTSSETAGVDKLEAMEPEPILGPLPVSNGPHKLAEFFAGHGRHRRTERELTPFANHLLLDDPFFQHHPLLAPFAAPGLEDPFFLHNPLLTLPYQSRAASIVPSRTSSPDPSEQLKSEQRTSDEEAALTLSMIRHGVTPAVAAEYLADRRQVQHGGHRPGGSTAADDLSRNAWLRINCG